MLAPWVQTTAAEDKTVAFSFNRFSDATKADTPQFALALARQTQLENEAEMQANALRSQHMGGAAELYNAGMGDKTPIADFFGGVNAPAEVAPEGLGGDVGNIYGDIAAEAEMGTAMAPVQEGLGLEAAAAADSGVLADLTAATEASELASGTEALMGATELAGGAEAALGATELAGAGATAAGTAGGSGLMGALGASSPYIAAALAAYKLFS